MARKALASANTEVAESARYPSEGSTKPKFYTRAARVYSVVYDSAQGHPTLQSMGIVAIRRVPCQFQVAASDRNALDSRPSRCDQRAHGQQIETGT